MPTLHDNDVTVTQFYWFCKK